MLLLGERAGFAGDVTSYFVSRGMIYAQTNSGPPVLKPQPYIHHARAALSDPTNVTLVRLSNSVNSSIFLLNPGGGSSLLSMASHLRHYGSAPTFDALVPSGTNTLRFTTVHDGTKYCTMVFSGSTVPEVPQVVNYTAAQAVDPRADFQVTWLPWAGAVPGDLITCEVFEARPVAVATPVFKTPSVPGAAGALGGGSTSANIPAGTLASNKTYLLRLRFDRVLGTNLHHYPGATGFVSNFKATDITMATLGVTNGPRIVHRSPADGATGVSLRAPLFWAFNIPMRGPFGVSMSPGPSGSFSSSITPDGLLRSTQSTTNFWATNTLIQVVLNPFNEFPTCGDGTNHVLMTDLGATFTTGSSIVPPPAPPAPLLRVDGPGQFTLLGETGRTHMVQYSAGLEQWAFAGLATTTNGSITISQTNSGGAGFHRALALP
jgi:hypothetical protein